jgi:tRNA modification GTPase
MMSGDTIAAIATAPGRGGIGVVRVSGPAVQIIANALVRSAPEPRVATHRVFYAADGAAIDDGLCVFFSAPHSYTGEDVLELQGHGGPAVLHAVLQACLSAGARIAEPGEFTRRAFLNGKLDLLQAESVADLIEAGSAQAVRSAMRSLRGEFSAAVHVLVEQLITLRALTEATLDFPEEEIDVVHREDAQQRLETLRAALGALLQRSQQGQLLRDGIHVVLVGLPNVGKSSLLNRLAGDARAIVSPIAGTTRDAIRETIIIEGVSFHMIDTAGLRDSQDEIERMGMARTHDEIQRADLIVLLSEAPLGFTPETQQLLSSFPTGVRCLRVCNKIDLAPADLRLPSDVLPLSAKTGTGIETLRQRLLSEAGWQNMGETVFLARERHLLALQAAAQHVDAAAQALAHWEFFAEELRLAQLALSSITGEFSADDLLGEIFSRFCIGK